MLVCIGIAPAFNDDVQDGRTIIDSTPQSLLVTWYADHHRVEVPFVSSGSKTATDLAEFNCPLAHRFMTNFDTMGW